MSAGEEPRRNGRDEISLRDAQQSECSGPALDRRSSCTTEKSRELVDVRDGRTTECLAVARRLDRLKRSWQIDGSRGLAGRVAILTSPPAGHLHREGFAEPGVFPSVRYAVFTGHAAHERARVRR